MKNVVIAGPIGDFGGRDIEVNSIARALEEEYEVTIVSTIYMGEDSLALEGLQRTAWKSVLKELYKKNRLLRVLSIGSKWMNRGLKKNYYYLINKFSKKLAKLDRLQWEILQDELKKADAVLLCVQLTSKYLPEIVTFCHQEKIPCLVRTTGSIRSVAGNSFTFLDKVSLFIHHSESNAHNLNRQIALPYRVIDQCTLTEGELLELPFNLRKQYRFGYLGRLSEEKGIVALAHFFASSERPFFIAGDGALKDEVLSIIEGKANCTYLGLVSNNEIRDFFEQIDVLVIPSYEESGPLVGLEAMAAGKLILSTNVGAMKERLKGIKSFWFEIENVSSLESCITAINALSESECQSVSEQLRERYRNNYSVNAIALKYKEVVQEALNKYGSDDSEVGRL